MQFLAHKLMFGLRRRGGTFFHGLLVLCSSFNGFQARLAPVLRNLYDRKYSAAHLLNRRLLNFMATAIMLDPKRRGEEADKLHRRLSRLVVGQDEAVREVVDMYQLYRTGMHAPGRPIGAFLFLGPTG